MATRREGMCAGLQALLASLAPSLPGLVVYRNPRQAFGEDVEMGLAFNDPPQSSQIDQTEYKVHTARVDIDGVLETDTDGELGPEINRVYGLLIDALESDVSLGGTATDIRETGFSIDIVTAEESKTPRALFRLSVDIEYTASRADSSQP